MALQEADDSLFGVERISLYVPLSPTSLISPLAAICASVFSPLLLTFYAPAKGVVLAHYNVKLSSTPPHHRSTKSNQRKRKHRERLSSDEASDEEEQNGEVLLHQIDEYSASFVWATASLLVWRPKLGIWVPGTLALQASTHITLNHLNIFPITVLKEHLPPLWSWHSAEKGKKKKGFDGRIADFGGWWVDADGKRIEFGKEWNVRIREWNGGIGAGIGRGRGKGGFVKIEGSLLTEEEEKKAWRVCARPDWKAKASERCCATRHMENLLGRQVNFYCDLCFTSTEEIDSA